MSHDPTDRPRRRGPAMGARKASAAGPMRSPAAGSDKPGPPLAHRGGVNLMPDGKAASEAWRGVDAFTVTLPTTLAVPMLESPPLGEFHHLQDGTSMRGGHRTAEYRMMGGSMWRRWEPWSASPRWGTDYEIWEATGAAGAVLADWLAPHADQVRSSRIDLAVDLVCSSELTPGEVVAPLNVGGWQTETGHAINHRARGTEAHWVWYVGSRSSERMLRFYRKDLDQPLLYPGLSCGIFRVELELKKPLSHPMFSAWSRDDVSAFAAYGRHVHEMTGRQLVPIGDLPPVDRQSNVEVLQTVLALIEQHGATIDQMHQEGIDLVELAAIRAARPVKDKGQRSRRLRKALDLRMLREGFGSVDALQTYLADVLLERNNPQST